MSSGDLTFGIANVGAPKGWVRLNEVFGELSVGSAPGGYARAAVLDMAPPDEAEADKAIRGLSAAMWAVLGKVTRVAILTPANLEPWSTDILKPDDPTWSYNHVLSLSHGRIGSGDEHDKREDWGDLWGCPVVLDAQQVNDAMEILKLRQTTREKTHRNRAEEDRAYDDAMDFFRRNGLDGLTNQKLKDIVAPTMGPRPWKRVWDRVTNEFPELSFRGRRPKIKT